MFSTALISHSRIRGPSSRRFPGMMWPAPPMQKARWGDGFLHRTAARRESRSLKTAASCAAASAPERRADGGNSDGANSAERLSAYLVASQTPGMSAVQFQRQLAVSATSGLSNSPQGSGMVRPNQDRIGGQPKNHVEVDETWVGGRTRGEGRGVHHKVPAPVRGASSKAGHQARQPERRTLSPLKKALLTGFTPAKLTDEVRCHPPRRCRTI